MSIAAILTLVSTASQIIPIAETTINNMIAEGRLTTTDAETAALKVAAGLQADAEATFVQNENENS